jgi:hypothetical protein
MAIDAVTAVRLGRDILPQTVRGFMPVVAANKTLCDRTPRRRSRRLTVPKVTPGRQETLQTAVEVC